MTSIDHALIVRRKQLPARRPIGFHRVVAGRVVARRDHDAARAMLIAHRKRKFRRAANALGDRNFESGRDHDLGTQFGEFDAAMPRVVGNRAARVSRPSQVALLRNWPSPGHFADRAVVDRVATDGVHAPSTPARAKGNDGPEHVVEFPPPIGLDMLNHLGGIFGVAGFGEPILDVIGS